MKKYYVTVGDDGSIFWYKDEKCTGLHREDEPAVERVDGGYRAWYLNGKRHREDGPAIVWASGDQMWWLNGERHRIDGPAIIWADSSKEWYIHGEDLTEEQFLARTQPAEELTIAQIEQLLNKRIKVIK